ncbi:MAG TPA: hypothetical protein VM451_08605 [Candidatus Limnocylindria bacterium]|nr:hypothetical protein [Candidatus Limnocylindria bacterium]
MVGPGGALVRQLRLGLVAALLAAGVALAPPSATPALAAGGLQIAADTVYTLDPEARRVHVAIDVRLTNTKPNSATFVYFYRHVRFPLQPDARAVRATDSAGTLSTTTKQHPRYVEAVVHLRANLYYRDSKSFKIRYDLVGGDPRSASPIRVGKAFATFGVWAWGDPGRGSVEVRTPAGFGSTIEGDELQIVNSTAGQTLTARPETPETFFAIVSSENRQAYGSTRVSLEGDVEIVIQAWPEDDAWDETVGDTLRAGLPELRELIGLDWPVDHDLNIRERFTPALEGYAGVFFTDDQRIDVSEDLDPVTIMHEASHAWFNDSLFVERWIYEGLAEEYAWRAQTGVDGEAGGLPDRPDPRDPGYVRLGTWTFPEVIRDQETDDSERYGYDTAFWVIHEVVTAAGPDQMRLAFEAAATDVTAYPGAGTPEKVAASDGWKRLLDLAQPIEDPDEAKVVKAFEDFVLGSSERRDLAGRDEARDAYRALLDAGDGWWPSWYVREPMGDWEFERAAPRMAEAMAVLGLRDQIIADAASEGLTLDGGLKTAYEAAPDGYEAATKLATDQLAAIASIADAHAKVDQAPDLIAQLGLIGETPRAGYDAARAAFERGRLQEASAAAVAAAVLVTKAPAVGQQRLLVGVAVAVLVLLVPAISVFVRRRRRAALALALASAPAAVDTAGFRPAVPGENRAPLERDAGAPIEPVQPEPSGTLAADPDGAPTPLSDGPPDVEGGPERGASPPVA